MAKALYDGVNGVARKVKKKYDGVSAVARAVKKAYDGVSGVARLYFEGLYYWSRYVSKRTSTSYGDYATNTGANISIKVFKPELYDGVITQSSDTTYVIHYYTGFSYYKPTGTFTMTGAATKNLYTHASMNSTEMSSFVGKYVNINGTVYKITGYTDLNYLICDEYYTRGNAIYSYSYYLDGEVSSEDPNAYPNESISSYTSTSSNDIRTKYVKK